MGLLFIVVIFTDGHRFSSATEDNVPRPIDIIAKTPCDEKTKSRIHSVEPLHQIEKGNMSQLVWIEGRPNISRYRTLD